MVGKTFTRALCCLFVLKLACGTLLAQSRPHTIHVSPSGRVVPGALPPANITIFSNLGPTPTDLYYSANGWVVTGPADVTFGEQWVAVPFIAKQNSHAFRLQVAVGYLSGTNKFTLGLYSDSGGTVGTALINTTVTNAPPFGVCCATVTKNLPPPGIALTAGTQYWVVARSTPTGADDFEGAWAFSNLGVAFNDAEAGWTTFSVGDFGAGQPAAAVLGTTP